MAKFNDEDYGVDNILSIFNQATASEIIEGLEWYSLAQSNIRYSLPNLPVWKSTAIVSALSPRMKWGDNIKAAVKVVKASDAGLEPADIKVQTFHANKEKAFRLAAIDNSLNAGIETIDAELKGNKTKAFAANLRGDLNRVTVDGHATFIAKGDQGALDKAPALTDRQYNYIQGLYQEAAKLACIQPAQLQAITWVTYRRIKGVK